MSEHHPELVADIDAFLNESGMSEITFGRKAMSDPHFVRDIRGRRRVWPTTEEKVRAFMAEYAASASPALCTTCDHRLDDTAIRACSIRECPHAQREAA
ncbi:hypothetical protein KFK14_11495 [Sphingobium phenoxybenzoativorans]|uniref:Uncharacterized protein n=1 Tax=Sphingobium phenoxybenzoativorans TaxID=1592790 RepID=A0A975KC31_9SPHN|nr:hypothetical protein [Sphingobium phenoxybenzoativorans]QUT07953.1 hypothetical protein KFK14_11495 [Sphingobium phenoxybenzoativorans]